MSRYHAGQRRHATDDADMDALEDLVYDYDAPDLDADRFGPTLPLPDVDEAS